MIVRQFGSSGVKIPIIGQGTWNLEGADKSTAIKSIQKGIDLGLTHVDTAEMYGHGCVEELLGHDTATSRGHAHSRATDRTIENFLDNFDWFE